jgi:hypothetical protein
VRKRAPHYRDIHLDLLMDFCAIFGNTNKNTNNFQARGILSGRKGRPFTVSGRHANPLVNPVPRPIRAREAQANYASFTVSGNSDPGERYLALDHIPSGMWASSVLLRVLPMTA